MKEFFTLEEIEDALHYHPLAIVYISREHCSVCHAVLPQVKNILADYPDTAGIFVSADKLPAAASKFEVFTAPAVLLYVKGRERWRGARFIPQEKLRHQLAQWSAALD